MVWVVETEGKVVFARLEEAGKIDVPFEAIVVVPPDSTLFAMGNKGTVYVEPAFIEEAGEFEVNFAFGFSGGEIDFGVVPTVAGKALTIGMANALRLDVEVGTKHFPLVSGVVFEGVGVIVGFVLFPEAQIYITIAPSAGESCVIGVAMKCPFQGQLLDQLAFGAIGKLGQLTILLHFAGPPGWTTFTVLFVGSVVGAVGAGV